MLTSGYYLRDKGPMDVPPIANVFFVKRKEAVMVCEFTVEELAERAESVALLLEALNWSGPVVFVQCPSCPWRSACPEFRKAPAALGAAGDLPPDPSE